MEIYHFQVYYVLEKYLKNIVNIIKSQSNYQFFPKINNSKNSVLKK